MAEGRGRNFFIPTPTGPTPTSPWASSSCPKPNGSPGVQRQLFFPIPPPVTRIVRQCAGKNNWLFSCAFNTNRPFVNIDYSIAIILTLAARKAWIIPFLFLFSVIDLIASSVPQFKTTGNFFALSDFLSIGSFLTVDQLLSVLIVCLVPCFFVNWLLIDNRRIPAFRCGLVFLAANGLMAIGDLLNGSSTLRSSETLWVQQNIAFSASYRISRQFRLDRKHQLTISFNRTESVLQNYLKSNQLEVRRNQTVIQNSTANPNNPRSSPGTHQIVFVIVESLGVLSLDPSREILFGPLLSLTNQYVFERGFVQFSGITIDAEKREFYGLKTTFATDLVLPSKPLTDILVDRGYELFAFHNYYSAMYNRRQSLIEIGFTNVVFLDDLLKANNNIELSGVLLRGATDRAMVSSISSVLTSEKLNRNQFVYWLTLSSHLPVDIKYSSRLKKMQRFENEKYKLLPVPVLHHETILGDTIDNVYKLLSFNPAINCDVIVVGDHAPPFGEDKYKNLYSKNIVPYLIMRHK